MRRTAALLAVAVLALGACDIQTATAPGGDLTLHATFDDAQDLTRGHYVQMGEVVVGSVGDLELDGYRARARLDIVDGRDIPVGTRAVVRRTSLLGEHYVDLVAPEGFDPERGPFLEDDAEIEDTASQLDLEALAERASAVIGAIDGTAVASTVDAADAAIGGRGNSLNEALRTAGRVSGSLRSQQDALAGAIDALAQLGATFGPRSDDLVALVDSVESTTRTVAASRDAAVGATEALTGLARSMTDQVIVPQGERIVDLLDQAEPVVASFAAKADAIERLFDNVAHFNNVLPTVVANGQVLIQAWLDPTVLLGGEIDLTDPVGIITNLLNVVL